MAAPAPFLRLGLAIAVINQIATAIPAMIPTVNGSYARYSDSKTTGMRIVSIQRALRRLFLVMRREEKNPPPIMTNVIIDKLNGAFRGLAVGIPDRVKVALGSRFSALILIVSPNGVLL